MKHLALLTSLLLLTGCKTLQLKQGKLTLPPPNGINIQEWEPKGCKLIDQMHTAKHCEYLTEKQCEGFLDAQAAEMGVPQQATHFWVKRRTYLEGHSMAKSGLIFNCTELLTKNQQGAKQ